MDVVLFICFSVLIIFLGIVGLKPRSAGRLLALSFVFCILTIGMFSTFVNIYSKQQHLWFVLLLFFLTAVFMLKIIRIR